MIHVRDLVSHYGERQVLHGIGLEVRQGEIMVVMGGSGSGKTTLLRHLLGLKRPSAGVVEVLGTDLAAANKKAMFDIRKRIGVAFQGGALFGSMTVAENIQLPLREHTKLDANTIKIMTRMKLEVVDLSGFEDLMPAELSGGMTKRVALARALIMDPQLLFFDEPSAGLDPIVSAELDDLILKLRKAMDMTIVVITHELHSALKIADRITILDQGQVLMSDAVERVTASEDPRVQAMLNRQPRDERIDADEYLQRLTRI